MSHSLIRQALPLGMRSLKTCASDKASVGPIECHLSMPSNTMQGPSVRQAQCLSPTDRANNAINAISTNLKSGGAEGGGRGRGGVGRGVDASRAVALTLNLDGD